MNYRESKGMEPIDKIISMLPPMEKCDQLTLGEGDVLVTVGGFEDRTLAAAQTINGNDRGRALVLMYEPKDKRNRLNDVLVALRKTGFVISDNDIIQFHRYDPESFSTYFNGRLKELNPRKIILDISAMSKLAMLLCLEVCWEMNLDTSVFYAEAEDKGPKYKEYEKAKNENNLHRPTIQVYTGIHGVIRVTGLSSVAMQGQPSAAIVFMSFNELLTQALLNAVYPSRLFLINSRSPNWRWREEATAWIHEQLRSEWSDADNPLQEQPDNGTKLPKRSVSTLDYKETVQTILELYWSLAVDHRILLAPTGSKMQTVGCFFVKVLHPDIHIEYPTPEGFLDTYSNGVGQTWIVRFGHLEAMVTGLRVDERKSLLGIGSEQVMLSTT
ncbi:MAG: hypothetical protein LC803_09640 [Acidobacteria bacterium]|nr:hypothetical protein [Acidobacteriota bacterium]